MTRIGRIALCAFFLVSQFAANSMGQAMKWNNRFQTYIDQYRDLAIEEMLRTGIPASITLAQGLFESGAGEGRLARLANNHFGIKCHGWKGRTISANDDAESECFRAYDNVKQSYEDHSAFLMRNQRYASLFKLKRTDYKGWAHGLKAAGYATNPNYANKLIDLIELYKLYEYDKAKSYDRFMASNAQHPSSVTLLHPIHIYNKNYFLQARKGDTFRSIAKEIGISAKKLAKHNERDVDDKLQTNEIIWLKKKQKKADIAYKGRTHRVKNGESMYSIAQYYGIRLKSLYKLNHMKPSDNLYVGQDLKLR